MGRPSAKAKPPRGIFARAADFVECAAAATFARPAID
jgi:hypothetical protein